MKTRLPSPIKDKTVWLMVILTVVMLASASCTRATDPTNDEGQFSTIDSSGFNARYVYLLCLDNNGIPHVLYQGFGEGDRPMTSGAFVHAVLQEGIWQNQVIQERDRWSCLYGSIQAAFDSSGALHCLYYVGGKNPGLKYGRKSSEQWTHQTVFDNNISENEMKRRFQVTSPSLPLLIPNFCMAAGKYDFLHIAFLDPAEHVLWYGTRHASQKQWKMQAIEDVGPHNISVSRIWPAITVGPNGEVLITYKKYSGDAKAGKLSIELKLATCSDKKWTFETITRLGYIDGRSQLAIDSEGHAHVLYTRAKPNKTLTLGMPPDIELVYATKERTEWKHETVFVLPEGNGTFSLALSPDGHPWVLVSSFKNTGRKLPEHGDIFLLKRQERKWSTTTVTEGGGSSVGAQMRIDKRGSAHIVFPSVADSKNGTLILKYTVISDGTSGEGDHARHPTNGCT